MVLCPLPCDKETVKTKEASSTSHPRGLALQKLLLNLKMERSASNLMSLMVALRLRKTF